MTQHFKGVIHEPTFSPHLQPPVPAKSLDGLLQTSLDLELDLQVSRTRQARLAQELRVLRELKRQLEKARTEGQRELPVWVQEDERFRLLLRQAEKQVLAGDRIRSLPFTAGFTEPHSGSDPDS